LELKSGSEANLSTPKASPGAEAVDWEHPRSSKFPTVGIPEFDERVQPAMTAVYQKYAWTAQHGGIILRRKPPGAFAQRKLLFVDRKTGMNRPAAKPDLKISTRAVAADTTVRLTRNRVQSSGCDLQL